MVKLWGLQWRGIFHHGDQGAHLPSPLSRLLRRKPRRAVLINWTLALEAFNHLLCIRAFHTEFDAGRQGKENSFSTFKGDQINQISSHSQVLEANSVDFRKKRLVADLFWRWLVMTLAESQMIFAKSTDRLDLVRKYGFATPLLVFRSLVQNAISYQKAASTCFYHIRLLHAIDIMEARPVQTVRSKLHAGGWYCADHRIYDLLEVKVGRSKGLWALASHSALASQMKRMKRCAAVPGDVHSPMARWR